MKNSNNSQRNLRRKVLVNPKFQIGFIGFMAVMSLFTAVSNYCVNAYFLSKYMDLSTVVSPKYNQFFSDFLADQRKTIETEFWLQTLFTCCILIGFGLIYSHRIVGPVEKIKNELIIYARTKRFKKIVLREYDLFKELADAYNELGAAGDQESKSDTDLKS